MQLTVKDLLALCQQEIEKGNGDRKILLGDDNEGNGYHGLFFGFTEFEEAEQNYMDGLMYDTQERDCKKILLLG